ncbi:MAG: flagellar hook capping FlgD N-terminal domain-containing protein [Myxococcota bacterium]
MSEVSSVSPLASLYGQPQEAPTTGSADLGKDAFLRLLTTQLQHQDPTNPVRNEDFVAQLAQFSSLEQLTGVNDRLEGVYMALAAMNNASMASLLGTEVVVRGNTFSYSGDGAVELDYAAPTDAVSSSLTVYDADGAVVWTGDVGALTAGDGTVTWPGVDTNGQHADEGTYTFAVTAFDANGDPVEIEEHMTGVIDEMDYSTGTPMPSIDGVSFSIADILSLTQDGR